MKRRFLLLFALIVVFRATGQQSFTLDEATDYAIQNSLSLQAKKLDNEVAIQDINGVKSIAMPKVNGGVDYQYYFAVPAQPVPDFITPAVYGVLFEENVIDRRDLGPPTVNELSFFQPHNLTGKIEANMLVYDGTYRYGLRAAKLYKDLTQKQIDAQAYEIKSAVRKAYLNVLITEENIAVIDNNLKVLSKNLNDVKTMYEVGIAESLDVDRLQLSYDQLSMQRNSLQQMVNLSKNLLKFQMGYPLEDEILLSEALDDLLQEIKIDQLSVPEFNLTDRPEYLVIEAGQKINDIDYLRNKAGYQPSVRAFASAQGSLQRTNLFDNNEAGWIPTSVAGLSINIPIYDGGEKKSRIAKTRIEAERINIQKKEFETAVNLQVTNAAIALQAAINTLEQRKKAITMTNAIYEKVNIKFTEGVGSSIEVSQAEASLYEAQANYITTLYEVISAKNDLDIALGNI